MSLPVEFPMAPSLYEAMFLQTKGQDFMALQKHAWTGKNSHTGQLLDSGFYAQQEIGGVHQAKQQLTQTEILVDAD